MATIYKGSSIYQDGSGEGGGLSEVVHDETLTGKGTAENPLGAIANIANFTRSAGGVNSVKGAFKAECYDVPRNNKHELFAFDGTLIGYLIPAWGNSGDVLGINERGEMKWQTMPIPNVDVWEDVTDKLDWVNVDDNRSTALLYRGARRLVINIEIAYSSDRGLNAVFLAFNDKISAYMGHSQDIVGYCSYNTENTEISNVNIKTGIVQCRDNRVDWRTMDANPKKIWGQIEIPLTAVNI